MTLKASPPLAPPNTPRPSPALIERCSLVATDNFRLAATSVRPPASVETRGKVLINPATAVKRGYYLRYAQFLAEHGFHVLTFDYRGVGGSRPKSLRGFRATMHEWALIDSSAALRWLDETTPSLPLALVGHSFGGQALGLIPESNRLRTAVTIASQSGYWGHWTGLKRWAIWGTWHLLIPAAITAFGYLPANKLGLFEDLPAGVAKEWARWGRHREYILRDEQYRVSFRAFDRPVLAYSFSDDPYAPKAAAEALQAMMPLATTTCRHRRPGDYGVRSLGHFGFFRERFRATLWKESLDWLAEAMSGPQAPDV